MEQKKRAWTYSRIGAPEDMHGSLKGQQKQLTNYAAQIGFEVVGESQDTSSGLNFDRSGLTDVMKAAVEGNMDVLLIMDFSRLGRDAVKTMDFACGLEQLGIDIYSPLEGQIKFTQLEEMYGSIATMRLE